MAYFGKYNILKLAYAFLDKPKEEISNWLSIY